MTNFENGDLIKWSYDHHLNGSCYTRRTKKGMFYGLVKHKRCYMGEQKAIVKFDGNKRMSRVKLEELILDL